MIGRRDLSLNDAHEVTTNWRAVAAQPSSQCGRAHGKISAFKAKIDDNQSDQTQSASLTHAATAGHAYVNHGDVCWLSEMYGLHFRVYYGASFIYFFKAISHHDP